MAGGATLGQYRLNVEWPTAPPILYFKMVVA